MKRFISASTDDNLSTSKDILRAVLEDNIAHPISSKDFTSLIYFMSGYTPDMSLREFVDSLDELRYQEGFHIKGMH